MGKKIDKVKEDNERGARRQIIEELFYDFNRSKAQIYWLNFTRGIFLGFGTVLGGTVVVALIIWILSQFTGWFPFTDQYLERLIEALQSTR